MVMPMSNFDRDKSMAENMFQILGMPLEMVFSQYSQMLDQVAPMFEQMGMGKDELVVDRHPAEGYWEIKMPDKSSIIVQMRVSTPDQNEKDYADVQVPDDLSGL